MLKERSLQVRLAGGGQRGGESGGAHFLQRALAGHVVVALLVVLRDAVCMCSCVLFQVLGPLEVLGARFANVGL